MERGAPFLVVFGVSYPFDMDADSVDVDVSIPLKLVPIDLHVGLTPERVVRHDLNAPRLGHATFNRCCDGIAGVPICAHFLARVEETMPADRVLN